MNATSEIEGRNDTEQRSGRLYPIQSLGEGLDELHHVPSIVLMGAA